MSSVNRLLVRLVSAVVLSLSAIPSAARAQVARTQGARPGAEQRAAVEAAIGRARAALAPVASIVGQWEGDAQISRGEGSAMTIRQGEDITWGASQTVLMIKRTGRSLDAAPRGEIVFEAAAVAWYDAATDKLRMQTHTDGRSLVVDAEVRRDTLIWSFPAGGGEVRYTIAVGNDTFHEIGEFLRPGAAPVKTFEMTLKRK